MNISSRNELRKYLIAIGSPSCSAMKLPELERVKIDIQRIEKLLINQQQCYERVLADQIYISATSNQIKNALTSWFASSERRNSDCVIIYYAGHGGGNREPNSHYLYTVESTESNFSNTTIKTSDLVQCLFPGNNNSPANILLILDVCYAGEGAKNALVSSFNEFRTATENKCFCIIASADSKTEAGDGDFVDAFDKVMQDSAWMSKCENKFVNPSDIVLNINKALEEKCKADKNAIQKAEYFNFGSSKEIKFFLNNHYLTKNNLQFYEHNLKEKITKIQSANQTVADLLWLLDYSTQEQVFKKVIQDCKERAFLVQTDEEKIQRWLVRRLGGCIGDFEQAKKYQVRIRSHQMRYDFDAFWQEFKQNIVNELNRENVIQGLANLCKQKSIIIAIYGLSFLEKEKIYQFYDFWSHLVNEVRSVEKRSFRSHLILLLAEKTESNLLEKLQPFNFIQLPTINEPQYCISLTPLEKILQKDVETWLCQTEVYDSLDLAGDCLESIVENEIPNWSEKPLDVLEEICQSVFQIEDGIAAIETYWKLAG
ncbi:MAG: caspase family protein [Nostoc sp. SerVER01]|nr:caspase family protein [Nostoc sp. SerVER01]